MSKSTGLYPSLSAGSGGSGIVSQAGAVLSLHAAEAVGLGRGLSQALTRWRKPLAEHDPGKIVLDLAIAGAVGGDYLADIGSDPLTPQLTSRNPPRQPEEGHPPGPVEPGSPPAERATNHTQRPKTPPKSQPKPAQANPSATRKIEASDEILEELAMRR